MRADDPLRPLGDGGDLGDRDGGGVRGEHRVLADQLVEGAEDLVLDVELFEDGLDHDVGVGGASRSVVVVIRPSAAPASSAESLPLATNRSKEDLMPSVPRVRRRR